MTALFDHASEVRDALRSIVADPALGSAPLADARIAANLLRDLLPDAPRETSLLLAAIASGVPAMLREHIGHGLAGGTAISLAAASLASRTAFSPEACQWVAAELAIALNLIPAEQAAPAARISSHPPTEISAEGSAAQVPAPTFAATGGDGPSARTSGPEPFRPGTARPGRRSGRARVALLAIVGLALAAAAGVGLHAALPGTAPHHRSLPSPHRGGRATTPVTPVTATAPDNAWIAQLASVSRTAGKAALDSALARVRRDVPRARVLDSDRYESLRPGYSVIYYAGPFTTGTQALSYCAAHGRATRDLCVGRYLSHNPADLRYQCYPPAASPSGNCTRPPAPSPARVVESYIAAVNQHNWARAWAAGGKNLTLTYSQFVAGYAHTSHVQITSITARGAAVTVLATATETNGTTQRYKLSYLVNGGIITAGQSTLLNG